MFLRARSPLGIRVIWLMILLGLTSCIPTISPKPKIDIEDGGFLSEEPCGPPCFWGIVPGKTTEEQAIEILQERGIFELCSAFDRERAGGERGIECGSRVFISFELGSDIVRGLRFNPPSTITVQDVIEKYGEPESVEVGGVGVHVLNYQMLLAYPKMFTLIRLSYQKEYPYLLTPLTSVREIVYYPEFGGEFSLREVWRGYGEYR